VIGLHLHRTLLVDFGLKESTILGYPIHDPVYNYVFVLLLIFDVLILARGLRIRSRGGTLVFLLLLDRYHDVFLPNMERKSIRVAHLSIYDECS
jgi:hypothetical protein